MSGRITSPHTFSWKLANLWLPATAPVYATTQITLSVFGKSALTASADL